MDCGCSDAVNHYGWLDGLSLRRFQSAGQWLLHAQAAPLRGGNVCLGLSDLVLAGPDVGSQRSRVRQERRPPRLDRNQPHRQDTTSRISVSESVEIYLWFIGGEWLLYCRRLVFPLVNDRRL